jgi:hypothetical protein
MRLNRKKSPTTKVTHWLSVHRQVLFVSIVVLLFSYLLVVKAVAATQLDYYSDEPDDYGIISRDLARVNDFFSGANSPDQARFPHVVSLPVVMVLGQESLWPGRMLYIFIHACYLVVVYRLFRLSLSKVKAFYGLSLVALSSYLFSFSVFTMTTGSSLFLLFGTLMLYIYLRYLKAPLKVYSINRLSMLGVVSGLAVASRFFAALILISIFIYDAWLSRRTIFSKQGVRFWAVPFELINIIFTLFILVVNLLPATPIFKIMASVFLCLGYIALFAYEYFIRHDIDTKIGFLDRWIFIVHTAFVTTLIASPIHLNIQNIIRIFEWSSIWHKTENYINPSRFDIFTIIGVKTGWFAAVAIFVALMVIAWRRQTRQFVSTYALFIILVIMNMAVFLKVKYVIVWYPLLLMPFFYLPLAYIFPDSLQQLKKPLGVILLLVLLFIPLQEQYRYWRLFPYGHSDGAQYGKQYIGWNKPGTITFESSRKIIDYFKVNQQALPAGEIDCRLVTSKRYNPWASEVLSLAFMRGGLPQYRCIKQKNQIKDPGYVLTSLYIPDEITVEIEKKYVKQKVFTQASVPVVTLWVLKD